MGKASSIFGAAGLIAVLTLLSRTMGLVRKLAQSWAMSDGAIAGIYDTANTIPNVLFEVAAGGALAGAVIPLVSRYLAPHLHRDQSRVVSALITWILTVSVPLALIVVVFSTSIIHVLLGEVSPTYISTGASLLSMFALQVPLYGLSVVFSGVLQAHKYFVLPALAPLLSSLIVVVVFAWYALTVGPDVDVVAIDSQAILLLGWGTTAGVVIFSLVQLPQVLKLVRVRLTWVFPGSTGRDTVRLGGAGLAALVAQQLAIVTILYTTNALADAGAFAVFNYAFAIFMVPYAVLAVPIATAVFPRISQACADGERATLHTLISRSTYLVVAMGLCAAVLIFTLAHPAKVVLELGNPINGLDMLLRAMALGVVGYSVLYHCARVLYALGRPYLVIVVNTVAWLSVITLLCGGYLGGLHGRQDVLMGVGVALSCGLTIGMLMMFWAVRRATAQSVLGSYWGKLACIVGSLIVVGTILYYLVPRVEFFVGGGIYGAFAAAIVAALFVASLIAVIIVRELKQKRAEQWN